MKIIKGRTIDIPKSAKAKITIGSKKLILSQKYAGVALTKSLNVLFCSKWWILR